MSESKYRQIFCEDFILSFFKPKNDKCSVCVQYNQCRQTGYLITDSLEKRNSTNTKSEKNKSEKKKEKVKAKEDEKYYVATFI